MATDNRKISVLSVEDDVRAVIRAKQELGKYVAKITEARAAFERSNRSTDAAVASTNKITEAVLEAKKAYEDGIITVKEYNRVIAEAAKPAKQAAPQRSAQESVDRFGTFGSQVFGAFGAGELGNVAGLFGDLASGLGTLNPAIVAGTVGVGALTLAMRAAQEATARVTEATKARIAAEREVNDFLRTATTELLNQRIEEVRSQLAFEQAEFARLSAARDEYYRQNIASPNDPVLEGLNLLRQSAGAAFGELTAYDNELAASAQRLSDLTTQNEALSFAQARSSQTAQDAAAAERELAAARSTAIDAGLRAVEERVRFEQQFREANTKTLETLLENEQNRREILQAQIESLGEIADADAKVQQELTRLNSELTDADLNIQRLSDRLKGFSGIQSAFGILQNIGKGISDILSPVQRRLQEQAERAKRIEEKTRPILDELDKLGQESLKKEAEFALKRVDIEAAYVEQSLKDAADYARQRVKIERDAASSILSAVARRDAVAFKEAKDRREEQLDDLRAQAEEEKNIRERDRRQKIDALNRELQDFRQANSQKRYELQRQYQYEIAAEQARVSTAQSAAIARATIENASSNSVLGIIRNFWQQRIAIEQQGASAALAAAAVGGSGATPYTANPNIVAARLALDLQRSGR